MWVSKQDFEDIRYETTDDGAIAKITINRPEVRNAFRPLTVTEMLRAFDMAHEDPQVGVIILTGEGDLAFCSGGDQKMPDTSAATGCRASTFLIFRKKSAPCPSRSWRWWRDTRLVVGMCSMLSAT